MDQLGKTRHGLGENLSTGFILEKRHDNKKNPLQKKGIYAGTFCF